MSEPVPHLCMIFEATGRFNAIGRVAMAQVEAVLAAGWKVSVVANRLDESLQGRVDWLKLYNPPRGFAVKWLSARHFIKKTMGDPKRFDIIHGHQPQIADLCDIFECHFLTRAALELGCWDVRTGLRGKLARLQERIVLRAEDRCYRRWNSETQLVCDSELTRSEFKRIYGLPTHQDVMIYPAPSWNPSSIEEQSNAKQALIGNWRGPVIGYLGGMQRRKGYQEILDAVAQHEDLFLLFGGVHSEQVVPPKQLENRFKGIGLVSDVNKFYAAIDVLVVPSLFEPFGLVCFEAAARGTPVIATKNVGALHELERFDCGLGWNLDEPIYPLVQSLIDNSHKQNENCRSMTSHYSFDNYASNLLCRYEKILDSKR